MDGVDILDLLDMTSLPDIAVVIPNLNGARWLPGCLDALAHQSLPSSETVVVDNGSTDESLPLLRSRYPHVRIIELKTNTGFAAAVNAGIRSTRAPWVALLNTDTRAAPDWLAELAKALAASDEKVGAVAGLMRWMENPDLVENAGDELSWQGAAEKRGHGEPVENFLQPGEVFSCCAGAALYRRSFLEATGGFDERFFAYLEDIDLGLRGRLMGFRYLYAPAATVLHHGHGSGMPGARYVRLTTRNRLALFIRHIPGRLLLRHLPQLLYGQWFFLVCNRRPWATLCGYAMLIRDGFHLRRQRAEFRNRCVLTPQEIDHLLKPCMKAPGLLRALWLKLEGGPA